MQPLPERVARLTLLIAFWCALGLAVDTARSDQRDPDLPILFEALTEAPDDAEARSLEAQIEALWLRTESATIGVLMTRALDAVADKALEIALTHLDDIVGMAPEFAEARNLRATVYNRLGHHQESLRDVEAVLALEPRHFGALTTKGLNLEALGDIAGAVASFRRALSINPHLAALKEAVQALEHEELERDI